MSADNYSDEDMAAVGRELMQAIKVFAPPGWHPMDCPSEIVGDLRNECDELQARIKALEDSLAFCSSESAAWAGRAGKAEAMAAKILDDVGAIASGEITIPAREYAMHILAEHGTNAAMQSPQSQKGQG